MYYQMKSDRSISNCAVPRCRSQKSLSTFQTCRNFDGSRRLPMFFVIHKPVPSRCSEKKISEKLRIKYSYNKNVSMSS